MREGKPPEDSRLLDLPHPIKVLNFRVRPSGHDGYIVGAAAESSIGMDLSSDGAMNAVASLPMSQRPVPKVKKTRDDGLVGDLHPPIIQIHPPILPIILSGYHLPLLDESGVHLMDIVFILLLLRCISKPPSVPGNKPCRTMSYLLLSTKREGIWIDLLHPTSSDVTSSDSQSLVTLLQITGIFLAIAIMCSTSNRFKIISVYQHCRLASRSPCPAH